MLCPVSTSNALDHDIAHSLQPSPVRPTHAPLHACMHPPNVRACMHSTWLRLQRATCNAPLSFSFHCHCPHPRSMALLILTFAQPLRHPTRPAAPCLQVSIPKRPCSCAVPWLRCWPAVTYSYRHSACKLTGWKRCGPSGLVGPPVGLAFSEHSQPMIRHALAVTDTSLGFRPKP